MWELVLALVVLVAFVFLLTNGMNDASAVVATMIACGAATPLQAVLWAASVGLVGAIFSGAAVAQTIIGLLNVPVSHQLLLVLLAGLTAAMLWNLFTWKLGIPSSSTHSLVGGLVGGAWAAAKLPDCMPVMSAAAVSPVAAEASVFSLTVSEKQQEEANAGEFWMDRQEKPLPKKEETQEQSLAIRKKKAPKKEPAVAGALAADPAGEERLPMVRTA